MDRDSTECIRHMSRRHRGRFCHTDFFVGLRRSAEGGPAACLGTSPVASQVNMMVVTTRERSINPGEMFTGERALEPSFVAMDISIHPRTPARSGRWHGPRDCRRTRTPILPW